MNSTTGALPARAPQVVEFDDVGFTYPGRAVLREYAELIGVQASACRDRAGTAGVTSSRPV